MIGLDIPGLLLTVLLIGPRYAPWVLLAAALQELFRILVGLSMGGEISEVWVGGMLGTTSGSGVPDLAIRLAGPLACMLLAAFFIRFRPGNLRTLVNPIARQANPLGTVMLKFAAASLLISLLRTIPR